MNYLCISFAFFKICSTKSFIPKKSFSIIPFLVKKIKSYPGSKLGKLIFTISLNLLFILFLKNAFLEIFWLTTKPILATSREFCKNFKTKKSISIFLPLLVTLSKSFFLLRQYFLANTIIKLKIKK